MTTGWEREKGGEEAEGDTGPVAPFEKIFSVSEPSTLRRQALDVR